MNTKRTIAAATGSVLLIVLTLIGLQHWAPSSELASFTDAGAKYANMRQIMIGLIDDGRYTRNLNGDWGLSDTSIREGVYYGYPSEYEIRMRGASNVNERDWKEYARIQFFSKDGTVKAAGVYDAFDAGTLLLWIDGGEITYGRRTDLAEWTPGPSYKFYYRKKQTKQTPGQN